MPSKKCVPRRAKQLRETSLSDAAWGGARFPVGNQPLASLSLGLGSSQLDSEQGNGGLKGFCSVSASCSFPTRL